MSGRPGWLRSNFDRAARRYDASVLQRFVYRPMHNLVIDELRSSTVSGARDAGGGGRGMPSVVDVGCGTGILADRLARELGLRVIGCDYSAGMLAQARSRNDSISWRQTDAADLPIPDASVDAVVSTAAFHWFGDQPGALREFARTLRPGGRVIIVMPGVGTRTASRIIGALSRLFGRVADWPSRDGMRAMLEGAGLNVSEPRVVPRAGDAIMPSILHLAIRPTSGEH